MEMKYVLLHHYRDYIQGLLKSRLAYPQKWTTIYNNAVVYQRERYPELQFKINNLMQNLTSKLKKQEVP